MRWVWSIVLAMLAILAMLASPASADDAADQAEAGREFAAGQAADRRKDWPTAIQHYVRANDLLPHPNAMFNIASDYEKLGNLRQAAVWYSDTSRRRAPPPIATRSSSCCASSRPDRPR